MEKPNILSAIAIILSVSQGYWDEINFKKQKPDLIANLLIQSEQFQFF
jgi:hypothetical protein